MPKGAYWMVITLQIWYTKRCLLVITLHIGYTKMCLLTEKIPIEWKCVFWLKMCLLNEKVPIDWKYAYWKVKRHNCSVFLNVYVSLIYIVMWCNEECLTKSQTFRFYIILVANSCNARRIATKWVSGGKKKKPLLLSWSSKQKLH